LREAAKGSIVYGPDPDEEIRKRAAARKLNVSALQSQSMKLLAEDLFSTTPDVHVDCLSDAIALVEAGPDVIEERSRAWVERRVSAVVGSKAQRVLNRCWPNTAAVARASFSEARTLDSLLEQDGVTVAIMQLSLLAHRGGLLDRLEARNVAVQGPDWKE